MKFTATGTAPSPHPELGSKRRRTRWDTWVSAERNPGSLTPSVQRSLEL